MLLLLRRDALVVVVVVVVVLVVLLLLLLSSFWGELVSEEVCCVALDRKELSAATTPHRIERTIKPNKRRSTAGKYFPPESWIVLE